MADSGSKYKMDTLVVFAFAIGFLLVAYDIALYMDNPNIKLAQNFICNYINVLCSNKVNIKIFYLSIFTFCSFGIHVKKIPKTSKFKYVSFAIIFLAFILVIGGSLFTFYPFFYALITGFSSVLFITSIIVFRRYFSYFGKDDQFNESNEVFKQEKKKMTKDDWEHFQIKAGRIAGYISNHLSTIY